MNKIINFDPDFGEISFYKMLDKVPDYSQATIHQTLSVIKLKELIIKHFGELDERTKTQYIVFNDSPNKINAFYLSVTAMTDDICFMYSMEDLSEDDYKKFERDLLYKSRKPREHWEGFLTGKIRNFLIN